MRPFLQASFDCCMPTQKVPDEKLYSIVAIVMPSCSTKEHFTHSSSSFFRVVANQWTAWAIRIVGLTPSGRPQTLCTTMENHWLYLCM